MKSLLNSKKINMKKLILLMLVCVCMITSCTKENEVIDTVKNPGKVYIQVDAVSNDGIVNSSESVTVN